MDLGALSQQFEANKGPILATAAAGVVGFALYSRRKAGGNTAAPAQAAPTTAGASSGGQTAGMRGANAYDSSASDVYGLIQPQMESLGKQVGDLNNKLNAVPVSTPAKATGPLAAQLYAPQGTGNYVRLPNGVGAEVESDGSLFGITSEQWAGLAAQGKTSTPTTIGKNVDFYSTERNTWQAMQDRLTTSTPATPATK